jgi:phage terminase large subunit-like protein
VVSVWRRRFEIGALDADVGSRAQQLQALLARVQNTTAVHIKDLSLGKLEHAATPGTALGVDGAVRARVRFASRAMR